MKANTVTIGEKEYFSPAGYPKFGFWYDESEKKYSIANLETKTVTPIFADEVIYSEVPFESWTVNYVVVRIGDYYYLADNNGNCFHQNRKPFVICRNVFVFDIDSRCVIAEGMEKKVIDGDYDKIGIEEYDGICYVFAYNKDKRYLIQISGDIYMGVNHLPYECNDCELINEGIIFNTKGKPLALFLLGKKDFSAFKKLQCKFDKDEKEDLIVKRLLPYSSEAFRMNNECWSLLLDCRVDDFEVCGKGLLLENDGTTYIYFPNGNVRTHERTSIKIWCAADGWYYRCGDTIFKFDSEWNQIAEEKISLRDACLFDLLDEIKKED